MANTLLNSDVITMSALSILHQKLNFIGSINRDYDNSFAQSGAKIGNTLRIRSPNQYSVRSGPILSTKDVLETSQTLTVSSQRGVDLNFTSNELTMNIELFEEIILHPAMAALASTVEADALNMVQDVYNQVNGMGVPQTFRNILLGRKILVDNLAPSDAERYIRMNTQDNVDVVDALKGLFQSSTNISSQYREGVMGTSAGFEWAENTLLSSQARGAANGAYVLNGVPASGAITAIVSTGAGAMVVGDIFTIAGVFRVHPETKVSTLVLQQFVVTAAYAGGAGTISFSPALNYTANGQQNVTAPANGAALVFAGTPSTAYSVSLGYHKNAFTFATADLVLPTGVDMSSRKTLDGISMRMVRQYDVNNDKFPLRFDILYGYKTIRPQLAVRLAAN